MNKVNLLSPRALCASRLWRGPCRGPVSVTACQGAAPLRPAGCSCRSSGRWGTTWRRSTTGPWRSICSEEPGTARPAGGPSPRPSAPSLARSWSTWKTPPTTAWKTAPWACRAQKAASAWRRARAWASGRSGAARGCAGSVGWPWRSAKPRWCPAVIVNSTGAARWSASSAERRWPSTSVWRKEVRGGRTRAPAAAGRTWGWGRSTEHLHHFSPAVIVSVPMHPNSPCRFTIIHFQTMLFVSFVWKGKGSGMCTETQGQEDETASFYNFW